MINNYLLGSGLLYKKKPQTNDSNIQTMATDQDLIKELKALIGEELKDCNHVLWPKVCQMQSTEKGRERLDNMIIGMIANEGMDIGSAIALVEQELAHIL